MRKCQEWLESHHKEMYDRIWSAGSSRPLFFNPRLPQHIREHLCLTKAPYITEALEAATASLSVEAQKRAAKDAQKKTAKAEAAEAKQADKLAKSVVTIKRIERNKKKFVTAVIGLEAFGLELKKVSGAVACLPDGKHKRCSGTDKRVGCKGPRQEVCYGLVRHQGSQRRRGDCRPGRRQRGGGRVPLGEVQGDTRGQHRACRRQEEEEGGRGLGAPLMIL